MKLYFLVVVVSFFSQASYAQKKEPILHDGQEVTLNETLTLEHTEKTIEFIDKKKGQVSKTIHKYLATFSDGSTSFIPGNSYCQVVCGENCVSKFSASTPYFSKTDDEALIFPSVYKVAGNVYPTKGDPSKATFVLKEITSGAALNLTCSLGILSSQWLPDFIQNTDPIGLNNITFNLGSAFTFKEFNQEFTSQQTLPPELEQELEQDIEVKLVDKVYAKHQSFRIPGEPYKHYSEFQYFQGTIYGKKNGKWKAIPDNFNSLKEFLEKNEIH